MRANIKSCLLSALLALPVPAWAMSCTVSSFPIADMGIYFAGIDTTRQYVIFLTCTSGGAVAQLTAGPSQNTGSTENRKMKHESKADTMPYQMCLDGACTTNFGNTGNQIGSLLIDDRNQGRFSFWVKIPGGQNQVSAGIYRDSVTITLTP
jgi:spore coat protein U-like protein